MSAAASLTPDQLVTQWTPKLRSIAYRTGVDLDDVRQTAWLLAAEKSAWGAVSIGDWLGAVETQTLVQRDGVNIYPSDDDGAGAYIGSAWLRGAVRDMLDDPCEVIAAAETVARAIGGEHGDDDARWQRIRQEIDMPRTSVEMAAARAKSKRQGRRDAAVLRALETMQRGLFDGPGGMV